MLIFKGSQVIKYYVMFAFLFVQTVPSPRTEAGGRLKKIVWVITHPCPCNILQFFTAVKNDNFQMKKIDIFLIFAQNMDCRYTLEPLQ